MGGGREGWEEVELTCTEDMVCTLIQANSDLQHHLFPALFYHLQRTSHVITPSFSLREHTLQIHPPLSDHTLPFLSPIFGANSFALSNHFFHSAQLQGSCGSSLQSLDRGRRLVHHHGNLMYRLTCRSSVYCHNARLERSPCEQVSPLQMRDGRGWLGHTQDKDTTGCVGLPPQMPGEWTCPCHR